MTFETLLRYIKESRGFDFTGYKRSSLMRRVGRRMSQLGVASYARVPGPFAGASR